MTDKNQSAALPNRTLSHENVFHPDTKDEGIASAFWWLEGSAMCPFYCTTLIWRTQRGKLASASYRATSSPALASKMENAGWDVESSSVARLCESAGCSRHITRSRNFTSEVAAR